VDEKNELVSFLIDHMTHGKIVFNKNPRNKRRIDCWSFRFIDLENYDELLDDAVLYFRSMGFIVVDHGVYMEIDNMFVRSK
jgi:hypothetical protein